MEICTEKGKVSEAEIMLTKRELDRLVKSLTDFQQQTDAYLAEEGVGGGFTHLHWIDSLPEGETSKEDLVFYVDLSK